jgi:hypothetical protein
MGLLVSGFALLAFAIPPLVLGLDSFIFDDISCVFSYTPKFRSHHRRYDYGRTLGLRILVSFSSFRHCHSPFWVSCIADSYLLVYT